MNYCDYCGLDDSDCKCYEHDLGKRILFIEECMKELIDDIKMIKDIVSNKMVK